MPRDLQTFPEPQTLRAPDDLARREPTLREFAEWVGRQGGSYRWGDIEGCALFRFYDESGYPISCVGRYTWFDLDDNEHAVPPAMGNAAGGLPHTYSALASRLEALSARAGEEVAR